MKSIDYQILRLFLVCDQWSTPAAVVRLTRAHGEAVKKYDYIEHRFEMLLREGLICRISTKVNKIHVYRYEITELGKQARDDAKKNPALQNPQPWINRVRAGMSSTGHEIVKRGRGAAIPSPEAPEMSYEMDLEGFIDAKRAGAFDDLMEDCDD